MKNTKLFYNLNLKKFSRELRRNMSSAERLLWAKIRKKQLKGLQIYRQRIIGNYIVDFYCPKAKMAIEIDGGQHYFDEEVEKDKKRDDYLNALGIKVLRFSNNEILENIEEVLEKIYEEI
jgi:very-short-patch-repair endonuclease